MKDDTIWLRDQVDDEEILALFTDDTDALHAAVRRLIDRLPDDDELESRLVETLETSLDEVCDDTDATIWITSILGEGGCQSASWLLVRCIGESEDEELQEAAGIALLRLGSLAIVVLLDAIEDDQFGVEARRAAYAALSNLGLMDDELLHARLAAFLEDRIDRELRPAPEGGAFGELTTLAARLGCRALLPTFEDLLARRFGGALPPLEDAIDALRENEGGVPFEPTIKPWEERYGWLYEDESERARVQRPPLRPFLEVPGADEALDGLEDDLEDD